MNAENQPHLSRADKEQIRGQYAARGDGAYKDTDEMLGTPMPEMIRLGSTDTVIGSYQIDSDDPTDPTVKSRFIEVVGTLSFDDPGQALQSMDMPHDIFLVRLVERPLDPVRPELGTELKPDTQYLGHDEKAPYTSMTREANQIKSKDDDVRALQAEAESKRKTPGNMRRLIFEAEERGREIKELNEKYKDAPKRVHYRRDLNRHKAVLQAAKDLKTVEAIPLEAPEGYPDRNFPTVEDFHEANIQKTAKLLIAEAMLAVYTHEVGIHNTAKEMEVYYGGMRDPEPDSEPVAELSPEEISALIKANEHKKARDSEFKGVSNAGVIVHNEGNTEYTGLQWLDAREDDPPGTLRFLEFRAVHDNPTETILNNRMWNYEFHEAVVSPGDGDVAALHYETLGKREKHRRVNNAFRRLNKLSAKKRAGKNQTSDITGEGTYVPVTDSEISNADESLDVQGMGVQMEDGHVDTGSAVINSEQMEEGSTEGES